MSPDRRRFPDWAERERRGDLEWIGENRHILWPAASAAFEAQGRGAIVVDTTSQPAPGKGNPFGYFLKEDLARLDEEDVNRMVTTYDPQQELVIVLLKSAQRTSTYTVQARPRE